MDIRVHPVVPRTYTNIAAGSNINCVTGRPGYSVGHGGPALSGGADTDSYNTDPIRPSRIRFQTNGTITMRFYLSTDKDTGATLYYDTTLTGFAGEWVDIAPDVIVAATTTADVTIGWPR